MKPKNIPAEPPPAEPTVEQLALLAATLSNSKIGDRVEPPGSLVSRAMAIWKEAQRLLDPPPLVQPVLPKPRRYPVELDDFLRLVLPNLSGRTGDKYGLFRDYLKFRLLNAIPPPSLWFDELVGSGVVSFGRNYFDFASPHIVKIFSKPSKNPPEPTKEDVDKLFAIWNTNSIPDSTSFRCHFRLFRAWYGVFHTAEVSKKRSAAAVISHNSQKREKSKSHPDSVKRDGRKGARPPRERLRQALEIEKPLT
jgi:hypothetical protein